MWRIMMSVSAHQEPSTVAQWENSERVVARVPCVGEYITMADDSPMYRVVVVIHCAFPAEVYAVLDARPQHEIVL